MWAAVRCEISGFKCIEIMQLKTLVQPRPGPSVIEPVQGYVLSFFLKHISKKSWASKGPGLH